jgi:2-hydroxy-3-keto-5-methylthiopentenyl-1-phosphate phosphatase
MEIETKIPPKLKNLFMAILKNVRGNIDENISLFKKHMKITEKWKQFVE